MSSLQNLQISQTFPGLIKTNDELALSGALSTLQDGAGNNTGIQLSSNAGDYGTVITSDESYTNGLSVLASGTFIGGTVDFQTSTVDFANATVTGLPDTNTTYDYGAVGAAGNISMALTGSDATNDVVVMQAGTNITLTDNGSNTFTIDAAGGGGASKSIVITTGTKDVWAGPIEQDVIISQVSIPANTVTGAATIEFRCPVFEGSEGLPIYVSGQIAPIAGNMGYVSFLGRQATSGGGDPHMWYRSFNVATNGDVYFKDTNGYYWPNSGGDPIVETTNVDWTVENFFTVVVWADHFNAKFTAFSPSLTITNA